VIIEHVAVWCRDLEAMLTFYTEMLGGVAGVRYENPANRFSSYFVSFGEGARLELMSRPGLREPGVQPGVGYAHVALRLGGAEAVDSAVERVRRQGVTVESEPRVTGDGYYEAVIVDPEDNRVELVA